MKLLFVDDFRLSVLKGDNVVDVSDVVRDIPHLEPNDLIVGLIQAFSKYRSKIEAKVAGSDGVPLASVRVRPPIPHPRNIVCMAVNYMEDGTRSEPAPINAFHKAPGAIIGQGDTMVLPDVPATNFEGEAELALVISKRARNVKAADAFDHIFGYMNFIDGSARGLPPPNNVFFQVKSRETFAPTGPFLVTADEFKEPQNLPIRLWVNGELKQSFNTNDMAHSIARCIEWASSIHTLEPGDILATGTNHRGLSSLQDGDRLELECAGCGRLSIHIRDDLKRTWARDTRSEREAKGLPPLTPQLTGKYAPKPS